MFHTNFDRISHRFLEIDVENLVTAAAKYMSLSSVYYTLQIEAGQKLIYKNEQ